MKGIGYISPKLQSMIENAKLKASHALEPGVLEVGNVNLIDRPVLPTPDNGWKSVNTITIGIGDGKTALIPTVIEGIQHSNKEAIEHFKKTREHMGIFSSQEAADAFDEKLHQDLGWIGSKNKWDDNSEGQEE